MTLLVAGCIWQARTAKNDDLGLCYHAHFGSHTWSKGPYYDEYGELIPNLTRYGSTSGDFTLIRHYHPDTELGYCAGNDWNNQEWKAYSGSPNFQVREYGSSHMWPEEPGNYIFVRHTEKRLIPVYAGSTDNLMESLSNPALHEKADCLRKEGATHIHARLTYRLTKDHIAYIVRTFAPPCNDLPQVEYEMETGLVEGHVVSWSGKSGKAYTYFNDGEYENAPGNYVFAKYEAEGIGPSVGEESKAAWVLLHTGEAENLRDALTGGDFRTVHAWKCSAALGATHIFTHVNQGARRREVSDLDAEHRPRCNRR